MKIIIHISENVYIKVDRRILLPPPPPPTHTQSTNLRKAAFGDVGFNEITKISNILMLQASQ